MGRHFSPSVCEQGTQRRVSLDDSGGVMMAGREQLANLIDCEKVDQG